MKIGNKYACDRCGRIESSKLKVTANPADNTKHICDHCKAEAFPQSVKLAHNH